jgi:2-polyprenyl-3-methyl-5-hydroxy-6-metoxy-1,4-benzoquinol methylase
MAKAFPTSQFVGYDFQPSSIEHAQAHAREHGVSANTRFETATAKEYPGSDFDLVTFFDCLHDMGRPRTSADRLSRTARG